jgi:O-antigen/teichoic acid export membrane protein
MNVEIILIIVLICIFFVVARHLEKRKKTPWKIIASMGGLLLFLIFFHRLLIEAINTLNLAVILPATIVIGYFIYKIIREYQNRNCHKTVK